MSKARRRMVRMLSTAVNLTFRGQSGGMSGLEPDKPERAARQMLDRLRILSNKDPNNQFGALFTRLQLLLFKYLGVTKR
jgi:hypothetical protein